MKRTIAAVLVAIMTILCIGGGYSESDALNGGIEAEEIIPDQLPEPEQESEENMATGDKLVNLDDLKVTYDKQQEDTNSLKSELSITNDGYNRFVDTLKADLSRGTFANGAYNPANQYLNPDYKNRVSSITAITFPYEATLTIASGFQIIPYLYQNGAWTSQGAKSGTYGVSANTSFYLQIKRATEITETADIKEFVSKIEVTGNLVEKKIKSLEDSDNYYMPLLNEHDWQIENFLVNDYAKIEVEQGHWGIINGTLDDNASDTTRIRAKKIYKIAKGQKVVFMGTDVQCYVNVLSDLINVTALQNSGWMSNTSTGIETVFTSNYDGYIYINFRFSDNSSIEPSDYDTYTYVVAKNPYNIPEKTVHVYQFGGAGNDWCFVRTPSGYDPKRAKPYPFVICNHGNGWTMNGTVKLANWTKRTMYIPSTDPDAGSDQYNVTDDSSLWYSNPTIEALLAAGYVVCGCENYGDALYGNNDCRNACVDFFHHVVKTYNVENRCYMIGASNGALTSLNAAYLLQGAVKAMILQYPLTCLVNQYEDHADHQAGIRSAYGITDSSITPENLAKAVATHDPLTVDVVDGQKIGVFPPTQLYYSENDAVVNYQVNAIALYDMLYSSNKVVEKYKKTGGHGDKSMFDPDAFVAWFDAN